MVGITGRMTFMAGSGAVRILRVSPLWSSISAMRRMASKTGSFQAKPFAARSFLRPRWVGR